MLNLIILGCRCKAKLILSRCTVLVIRGPCQQVISIVELPNCHDRLQPEQSTSLDFRNKLKVAIMMHPSRQAYVEEDEPEVSLTFSKSAYLRDVHTSASEWQMSLVEGLPKAKLSGYGLMGWWGIRTRRWGWISQIYVCARSLNFSWCLCSILSSH